MFGDRSGAPFRVQPAPGVHTYVRTDFRVGVTSTSTSYCLAAFPAATYCLADFWRAIGQPSSANLSPYSNALWWIQSHSPAGTSLGAGWHDRRSRHQLMMAMADPESTSVSLEDFDMMIALSVTVTAWVQVGSKIYRTLVSSRDAVLLKIRANKRPSFLVARTFFLYSI